MSTGRVSNGPGTAEWPVWTTTARVVVTDPATLTRARGLVADHLARVDAAASRFRPDSEVSRLAEADVPPTARISPLLAELIQAALDAAGTTGGAVDPTLGWTLTELGYDSDLDARAHESSAVPAGQIVVHRRTDWRVVRVDGLYLTMPPGTLLDLGATAKAHAADHCATTVARRLGCGVMVSLGGDLRVAGPAPDGGWGVLVQDGPAEPASAIRLTGADAVATSSTAHRTWRYRDQLHHHVIDPASGRPAAAVWRTATVAADTCLRANTLSTAALVWGHDAPDHLRRMNAVARLVSSDGTVTTLGGWPA